MIGISPLRWFLTLIFVTTSGYHLVRCLRGPGRASCASRLSEALHLLMGVAMIAMIWPWAGYVPAAYWVGAFTCASGWFIAQAVRATRSDPAAAYFASVTGAMVWMGGTAPDHPLGHVAGHPHGTALPGSTAEAWVSVALGLYLTLAAGWWVVRGMRIEAIGRAGAAPHRAPIQWISLCHALMSAGMGLALLAMA